MIVGCHGDGLMNHLSAHSPLAPQRRADATAWPRATSPSIAARRTSPMVSGLAEERPLFYMHFMKWLITWGQGSILLLPIISEPSEARTESTRRKSEIMAGYCRPPLSRTAVYCFVLCTLLFISHGL